ncbi:MAG: hypothetical protein KatS3mg057_2825 [Herpetosiphonaceae bacterium]|nr:MAG: hypothetical protein KatS3mg057_2825 [Herpetosiphonaceae bacterium]
MSVRNRSRWIALLMIMALILAACGSNQPATAPSPEQQGQSEPTKAKRYLSAAARNGDCSRRSNRHPRPGYVGIRAI